MTDQVLKGESSLADEIVQIQSRKVANHFDLEKQDHKR